MPGTRTVFAARENVAPLKNPEDAAAATKRRFSSPAAARSTARKSSGVVRAPERDPSPAGKGASRPSSPALSRGNSRPSSPVPSKCDVPGLVAAKEENRRVVREPAIVVPSRYRQPSPVGGRKAASPMGRRGSTSPGRRLSGGLKVSPMAGEAGSKKKMAAVIAGISRVSDALMGSAKLVRKSWDDTSPNATAASEPKEKGVLKSKPDKQAILRTQVAISRRLSDTESRQSSCDDTQMDDKPRVSQKIKSSSVPEKSNRIASKITVHDRKWTDGSIPLDALSENLVRLGKEAFPRRSIASTAAVEALEEACATESIIRSLSMFSDLCSSLKFGSPLHAIDRFLSIYEDVVKWAAVAESLVVGRSSDKPSNVIPNERYKSSSLWIEAALATNLEVVSLLSSGTEGPLKRKNSEKIISALKDSEKASLEPPRTSLPKRYSFGTPAKNQTKTSTSPTNIWSRGYKVGETLELANALRREMQIWFLKFIEDAVDVGFHLFGGHSGDGGQTSCDDNARVAAVLSHLKRVNDWLDGVGRKPEDPLRETVERLKRKIYGFVICHVGSAFDSSISLSTA